MKNLLILLLLAATTFYVWHQETGGNKTHESIKSTLADGTIWIENLVAERRPAEDTTLDKKSARSQELAAVAPPPTPVIEEPYALDESSKTNNIPLNAARSQALQTYSRVIQLIDAQQ